MHSKLHHGTTVASPSSRRARCCTPNGIRTRVTALKGRRPRPLDDGGSCREGSVTIAGAPSAPSPMQATTSTVAAISFPDPAGTPVVPDALRRPPSPTGPRPRRPPACPVRDRLLGAGVAARAVRHPRGHRRAGGRQRDDAITDSAASGPAPTHRGPARARRRAGTPPDQWPAEVQPLVAFVEQHRGAQFDHPVPITYLTRERVRGRGPGRDAGRPTAEDTTDLENGEGAAPRRSVWLDADVDLARRHEPALRRWHPRLLRPRGRTRSRCSAPTSTSPTGSPSCTSSPTPGRTSTATSTSSTTSTTTPGLHVAGRSPRATPCASRTSTSTRSRRRDRDAYDSQSEQQGGRGRPRRRARRPDRRLRQPLRPRCALRRGARRAGRQRRDRQRARRSAGGRGRPDRARPVLLDGTQPVEVAEPLGARRRRASRRRRLRRRLAGSSTLSERVDPRDALHARRRVGGRPERHLPPGRHGSAPLRPTRASPPPTPTRPPLASAQWAAAMPAGYGATVERIGDVAVLRRCEPASGDADVVGSHRGGAAVPAPCAPRSSTRCSRSGSPLD